MILPIRITITGAPQNIMVRMPGIGASLPASTITQVKPITSGYVRFGLFRSRYKS